MPVTASISDMLQASDDCCSRLHWRALQVRCIAAVLLMVGRGQEQPSIMQQLLDIGRFPSKPQYALAEDEPLLLFSCGFEGIQWHRSEASLAKCLAVIGSQLQQHLVAAALTSSIYEQVQQDRAALLVPAANQKQQAVAHQDLGFVLSNQQHQQQQHTLQQQQQQSVDRQQPTQPELGTVGSTALGAAGPSRWLLPKPPHIKLAQRATEPSIEERFRKAGISLELLNQKGASGQE